VAVISISSLVSISASPLELAPGIIKKKTVCYEWILLEPYYVAQVLVQVLVPVLVLVFLLSPPVFG